MIRTSARPPRRPTRTAGPCADAALLRCAGGEQGIALLAVLLALGAMTTIGLVYLLQTTVQARAVGAARERMLALYAADAGLEEALVRLNFRSRTATMNVNGSAVRVWIPRGLVTSGSGPTDWRFVNDDGVNNGYGSPAPCGGSGLNDCSGLDATADDWAEYYAGWQARIWYASQAWLTQNAAALPAGEDHHATLFDFTTRRPLIELGIGTNPAASGLSTTSNAAGIRVRHKLDAEQNLIFTDGVKQFTAAEGILSRTAGGVGLTAGSTNGRPPAWPVYQLESIGRSGRALRRVVAEAANFPVELTETALYVCGDPNNPPTIEGGGEFLVSGYDYPMFDSSSQLIQPPLGNSTTGMVPRDPSQESSAPVSGVTVCCNKGPYACTQPGDELAAVEKQIEGTTFYGGDTGDGDTVQVGEVDVLSLYESYVAFISSSGCGTTSCDVTKTLDAMGSPTNFVIARVTGPDPIGFPSLMFGVLLINAPPGTLKISGNTRFYGLMIAVGSGTIEFNGTMAIVGAAFVGADVTMKGNPKLFYSRDALGRIRQLTYVRVMRFWEQVF